MTVQAVMLSVATPDHRCDPSLRQGDQNRAPIFCGLIE
jgi:hypothetical protein